MPNYQNGKIYKLISEQTDDLYVGSTTKPRLSSRLAEHRYDFVRNAGNTSKALMQYDDVKIILLEGFPCNTKDELRARENLWQQQLKNHAVNNNLAIGQDNVKRDASNQKFRLNNAAKLRARDKAYYHANKEEINAKRLLKHICKCGKQYSEIHKHRHDKTIKHQNYLATL